MKIKIILSGALWILQCIVCNATDGPWAVSKISPELLKNANTVLRLEEVNFEIVSLKETVEKQHLVITILNDNGDRWAEFAEYYDKLRELNSVEGFLYDANGKQIKKMKYKDLEDLSGSDGVSFMDDNRFKRYNFYYKSYPYTVEFEWEARYNHSFYFPMWIPQGGEKMAVERSQISIVAWRRARPLDRP